MPENWCPDWFLEYTFWRPQWETAWYITHVGDCALLEIPAWDPQVNSDSAEKLHRRLCSQLPIFLNVGNGLYCFGKVSHSYNVWVFELNTNVWHSSTKLKYKFRGPQIESMLSSAACVEVNLFLYWLKWTVNAKYSMTDIEWYIILIYALKADIYIVLKTELYIALKTAPIPISGSGIPIFYAEDCMHAARGE